MKLKFKILNAVLFLLNLKTAHTGLIRNESKSFTIHEYEFIHTTGDMSMPDNQLIRESIDQFLENARLKLYLYNSDAIAVKVRKKKHFKNCCLRINFIA